MSASDVVIVLIAAVLVGAVTFSNIGGPAVNTENMTISELFTGSKPVYYTNENSDFNITVLDKVKNRILILDEYNVIYRIEKTGKIDSTDNMTVFYNTEIGKQYKGNFYTVYYENMTFSRIVSLNYIKC
jgi:hypothetical protein